MYEKNSEGDWEEFADDAAKLKWVDNIVDEIREESYISRPTNTAPKPMWFFFFGEDGKPAKKEQGVYMLPKPGEFDFYFIYNKSKIYGLE